MKKLFLAAIILFNFSCKKDAQLKTADNYQTPTSMSSLATTSMVDVKTQGAKGDGVTDDTQAIIKALAYAKTNNISSIFFPDGTYLIGGAGNTCGVIPLVNGVSMTGNSPSTCHLHLSPGRYNPTS